MSPTQLGQVPGDPVVHTPSISQTAAPSGSSGGLSFKAAPVQVGLEAEPWSLCSLHAMLCMLPPTHSSLEDMAPVTRCSFVCDV